MNDTDSEMRILTVRQPWAWALIHGGKDVENRSRNIAGAYRGPVAIHAGRERERFVWGRVEHLAGKRWTEEQDVRGAIIGVVDLVDVHPERFYGTLCVCTSEWADISAWHLVLANPRPLAEPIPYKGGQGLRRMPADVVAAIAAEVTL